MNRPCQPEYICLASKYRSLAAGDGVTDHVRDAIAGTPSQVPESGGEDWERRYAELARRLGRQTGPLFEAASELAAELNRREERLSRTWILEVLGGMGCRMAHDLNNVLQVVLCSYDRLVSGVDPSRQARAMELGRQAAERGAAQTQELLTFARRQAVPPAGAGGKATEDRRQSAMILLAEDDHRLRNDTAGDLRDRGHQVVEAANAETARALSSVLVGLDLVIAGTTFPAGGGQQLVRQLRLERPNLPALFLADADERPGSADRMVKPFAFPSLAAAVDRALAERPPSDGRDPTLSARLVSSLTNPLLRDVAAAWRAARGGDLLPRLDLLGGLLLRNADWHFVAAVDRRSQPPRLHFSSVGRGLAGFPELFDALDADCARAELSLLPGYHRARFGDQPQTPTYFERLSMPVSEDGETFSHLLGVVLLTEAGPTDPL